EDAREPRIQSDGQPGRQRPQRAEHGGEEDAAERPPAGAEDRREVAPGEVAKELEEPPRAEEKGGQEQCEEDDRQCPRRSLRRPRSADAWGRTDGEPANRS